MQVFILLLVPILGHKLSLIIESISLCMLLTFLYITSYHFPLYIYTTVMNILKGLRKAKMKIYIFSSRQNCANATNHVRLGAICKKILDEWFLHISPKRCFA